MITAGNGLETDSGSAGSAESASGPPRRVTVSVEESLHVVREIARLDGLVEGIRLMVERRKSELVQEAAARASKKPLSPSSPST